MSLDHVLLNNPNALSLPTSLLKRLTYSSLLGASLSLTLANLAKIYAGVLVVLVADTVSASKIEDELRFFLGQSPEQNPEIPIFMFPDWETLPYDTFSPHQDIISERLTTLYTLLNLKKGVLLVPITTLMHRLCPRDYLLQNTLFLKEKQTISLPLMRKQLVESGYCSVATVLRHGEFAVRGSILDLYPMGSTDPIRLDLFGDEIDSIRYFDPETQRSLEKVSEINCLPAREFPLTEEGISCFRTQFRETFEGPLNQCALYREVTEGNMPAGLEYYLPLFFEKTSHLFEYIPKESLIVQIENIEKTADAFWNHIKERYDQYGHDRLRPILEPEQLYLVPNEVFLNIKFFAKISLTEAMIEHDKNKGFISDFDINPLPSLSLDARKENPLEKLDHFLKTFSGSTLFCAESNGRKSVLKELLAKIDCYPVEVVGWSAVQNAESFSKQLVVAPLEKGMIIGQQLAIITESDLLGPRVMQRRLRKTARLVNQEREVQNLAELTMGAPVVHIEHGIGRYLGLTQLNHSGTETAEFLTLEYQGGDKLYVPVASLHLISRYSGADIEHVPLHRLGSDQWQKAKNKALLQVRDVAAELLVIHAKRSQKEGFAFPKPDTYFDAFCAEFPFEETPDQTKAIHEVMLDLTRSHPMDRVVCGDVGFGKTEVALRAAFIVAYAKKQVAVLVPTTLLAEQHFQTFKDRFANFPIKVEVLSRFKTRQEQIEISERVANGDVDILIGTHKILQDSLTFKALGLLIIDEEHRFGVNQKEAFKALRAEIDILTLTATPIPRTLNMAMSGMRDLSIIATPPQKRLSIKTFVRERHSTLILEAVTRELYRGGQVYFLHNDIDTIEREAEILAKLIPTATIAVAHGKMPERTLERIMSDFYHRRYQVLVCTTIIETGIDIPTANTIIIDRADKLGLAQLHQLRGRVGRSHHQAYAFCLIPPKAKISADATKRLEALVGMEDLGSGFTLATQDLEIRGAGELLGDAQSGNIQSIGFQLYSELLEEAVNALKRGDVLDTQFSLKKGVEIDLKIPALIPDTYIPDVHTRLILYKRIASLKTEEAIMGLEFEFIDRFGALPSQTKNLFKLALIRLKAEKLGILKIDAHQKGGFFEFSKNPNIQPIKIIQLIQQLPDSYQLEGPQKLRFKADLKEIDVRIKTVIDLMEGLI